MYHQHVESLIPPPPLSDLCLDVLDSIDPIPAVAIGGIKLENAQDLMKGANRLAGLAIVSAIIASSDPKATCIDFNKIIRGCLAQAPKTTDSALEARQFAIQAAKNVRAVGPMVHHITSKYGYTFSPPDPSFTRSML